MEGDKKIFLYIFGGGTVLTLLFFLFFTFKTVEGEEDIIMQYAKDMSTSTQYASITTAGDFVRIRGETTLLLEEVSAQSESAKNYASGPLTEIKFNPRESAESIEINSYIYSIAKDAVSATELPDNLKNPLVVLAQAATEFGGYQDGIKVWVPAIPNAFMDSTQVTLATVQDFNYGKLLALGRDNQAVKKQLGNKSFVGPLQLSENYGVWTVDINELNYKDEMSNIKANTNALRVYNVTKPPVRNAETNSSKRAMIGDRWNWNDASWSAASYWANNYKRMGEGRQQIVNKSLESYVAFIALQHNVGESIAVSFDSTSTSIYRGATISDAWEFIEWFSEPEVAKAFEDLARERLKLLDNGRSPMGLLNKDEGALILEKVGSSLTARNVIMANVRAGSSSGKSFEVPMHAMKMVLAYKTLELRYSGE